MSQQSTDTGGKIQPSTAADRPTGRRPLWLQEALGTEHGGDAPMLSETVQADVCIVGGGYTGLWTALRVTELAPAASVVVVEADICGGAASGRNGGFVLSWWPKIETLVGRFGREDGLRLAEASEAVIGEIGAFCEANGIDAHFRQAGWLWTATSPAQMNAWVGSVRACEDLGARPFQTLSVNEVRDRTGSPVHLGGIFEPCAATVQPALLARGLRRVAMERGIRIFEFSPMVSFDRDRGIVRTAFGEIHSDTIVLAMNAYAAGIRDLRRAIEPLGSDMVATEPIPDILDGIGWTGGESISNSRLMVHYYRTTRDGRIAFGRGGGALGIGGRIGMDFEYSPEREREVASDLARLVPAARGARITHAWAGAVDRSPDGLPVLGRLSGRNPVLYGIGFSGNGVGPTAMAAKILASTALGLKDQWSESALNCGIPSRFPPEPIRYFGGLLVREAVERKETREDVGREVDPITRRLASLAPSGYFKVTPGDKRSEA